MTFSQIGKGIGFSSIKFREHRFDCIFIFKCCVLAGKAGALPARWLEKYRDPPKCRVVKIHIPLKRRFSGVLRQLKK